MIPFYLLLVGLFSYFCVGFIKKYRNLLYALCIGLDVFTVYMVWTEKAWSLPEWLKLLFGGLYGGIIGVSFIVVVMYLGVLKKDSKFRKRLMPIRGELSILGCLLILGHNLSFGKGVVEELMIGLYTNAPLYNVAILSSVVLILLMLILLITSFPIVRKKMDGKSWKRIQRLAYPFFVLIYIHYVLVFVPWLAPEFHWYNLLSTISYSLIYFIYMYLKLKKEKSKGLGILAVLALFGFLVLVGTLGSKSSHDFYSEIKKEGVHAKVTEAKLEADYKDGIYQGEGQGKTEKLMVQIEIKENRIISIESINPPEEEHPQIHWAINSVFPEIIETQRLDVEGVSASKETNQGLVEAVKKALEQAE